MKLALFNTNSLSRDILCRRDIREEISAYKLFSWPKYLASTRHAGNRTSTNCIVDGDIVMLVNRSDC